MRPPPFLAAIGARALQLMDPETAHRMTIAALGRGLGPRVDIADPRLGVRVAGLAFANPLGLAAGFDKNASVPDACLDLGFGFVEVGAATPRPQPGNPRPRVFRLREDGAVINRYGFNNDGLAAIAERLRARAPGGGIVGVNLGANKDAEDRIADFERGVAALDGLVSFYTVNISSPNTPGLRDLQGGDALHELLARVLLARDNTGAKAPVFLKIAPDLDDEALADILAAIEAHAVDALIVSNTTLARPEGLVGEARSEAGGLSGRPLYRPSTALLREIRAARGSKTALIGVGGVDSARAAYGKIIAGASLVQLYTALIFEGPGLPARILKELPDYLEADGFSTVAEAVGADV